MSTEHYNKEIEEQKKEKECIAKAMGQAIRLLRNNKKLSQGKVCKKGNIDPVVFQRYDTGKVAPGIYNLLKIAKGIEIHPSKILEKAVEFLNSDAENNE
ncbi:hypothetical protein ATE84_2880 [Aquimarina sp. MAR_2010_214]|uniref:helix-turn-helix domain-containing protein n=1 Tax=Aquimarina sp. MAR_2010_214 TaxID=1250026 RepID=UPI000C70EA83|nr:helix-turn-helix transcriptional regulator [Aquimarina sp. MAR_2010_214]PKV50813.1 hypothetical protein ATE84_2880 [Aquimarina sp. MAR_2010_214]